MKVPDFSVLIRWLLSTELFAQPSRQIPGKWQLFEYYTEPAGKLLNIKEEQLNKENRFWEMEFSENGIFSQKTNIPFEFPRGINACRWSRSRNFITLIYPDDFRQNTEFQFAVDNGRLKLLKKNADGKIELFGFFRKK